MADEKIDVESLAKKLMEMLGKHKPAGDLDDDGDGRGPPRSVPYHRLVEERAARKAADTALADLATQVAALQQGYDQRLAKVREDVAGEVKTIGQRHLEDLALVDAGMTDHLGRQTLRVAWDAAPKESRGKSPVEWWATITAAQQAHLADPEKAKAPEVPRPLQPYLPAPAAEMKQERRQEQQQSAWGAKPGAASAPGKTTARGVDDIPVDQGMDAFFAGLRKLGA